MISSFTWNAILQTEFPKVIGWRTVFLITSGVVMHYAAFFFFAQECPPVLAAEISLFVIESALLSVSVLIADPGPAGLPVEPAQVATWQVEHTY